MKNKNNQYIVLFGNTEIVFTVDWKDRTNLAVHVLPNSQVVVEAPPGTDLKLIKEKVTKKGAWILKQKKRFSHLPPYLPDREYVSGETHRYLGRQYRLKIIAISDKEPERVRMDRGRLKIYVRDPDDLGRKKGLLDDWYRGHAKRVFTERVEIWVPHFQRYRIGEPMIAVRRMKSQWGSCTPEGKITLNLRLIRVPKHLIDYIIVHELCHMVELNHSEDFYQLLKRVMPDWEERRLMLNHFEV